MLPLTGIKPPLSTVLISVGIKPGVVTVHSHIENPKGGLIAFIEDRLDFNLLT